MSVLERLGTVGSYSKGALIAPIRWINLCPVESAIGFPICLCWVVIYPLDSSIQRLDNWGQNYIHGGEVSKL